MTQRVQDAETGEWLEIEAPLNIDRAVMKCNYAAAGMYSPNKLEKGEIHCETQSTRALGGQINWGKRMNAMRANYERKARESLRGLEEQMQDPSLTKEKGRELQVKILDKVKLQLKTQLSQLVTEEMTREAERQELYAAQVSEHERKRMHEKHTREREYYKTLIEHSKEENNMLYNRFEIMVDDLQSSEELAFVAEEVDRIILQTVDYILRDQTYDDNNVAHWVDSICDGIMKGLGELRKPLKYIVSCIIMQKNGAGVHSAVSCHWDTAIDGAHVVKWPSDKHKDHSPSNKVPFMSALLLAWLNGEIKLERSIQSLEKDLSNGYLLGQLLIHLGIDQDSSYNDTDVVSSVLANFEQLATSLRHADITLPVELVRGIMMEKKGAVAKLLIQIKNYVDRKQSKPHHLEPSTASLRPPPAGKSRHMPHIEPADAKERFVDNLISTIDPSDWNNHNRVDMAIHLRKFSEFMWNTEENTANFFANEKEKQLNQKQQQRSSELTHTHEKQSFLKQWTDKGLEEWTANQKHKCNREAEELQFELSLRERRRVIVAHQNDAAAMDLADGVSSFDKNFKRLGISNGDDDNPQRLTPIQGTGLEHLVELERRVEACHFRPSSNIQMMKELREKRKMHLNAQRERASRRRKMLVDQTRNTIQVNRKQEETELLHRLVVVGKRRRESLAQLWEARHQHNKAKEETNTTLVVKKDKFVGELEDAVATSLQALHEQVMAPEIVAKREEILRVAQEENRAHNERKHLAHTVLCTSVLNMFLDFVHVIISIREKEQQPLQPSVYRALKQQFISGEIYGQHHKGKPVPTEFSTTELHFLVRDYLQCRGPFTVPGLSKSIECEQSTIITQTLHRLATMPEEELLNTSWPAIEPLQHPYLICWYAKDSKSILASTMALAWRMQLITIEMCIDRCTKQSERGKPIAGEKPSPLEVEMAALATKAAQAKAKTGHIADNMVSDMVCKAVLHIFLSSQQDPSFLGLVLVNYPRTKDEAKQFEIEMIKHLTELSDTEASARLTQLMAGIEDKPDTPRPQSSIDWVIFVDTPTQLLIENDDKKDEMISRCEAWTSTASSLQAFWKPFGCVFTVGINDPTDYAIKESLNALIRQPPLQSHLLQTTDSIAFTELLNHTKQIRRQSMPRDELLICRHLCGELKLPKITIHELDQDLRINDIDVIATRRMNIMHIFYEGIFQISHIVVSFRRKLLELLSGNQSQQSQINQALHKLHHLNKTNSKQYQLASKQIIMGLEVSLGDIVDDLRKCANEFIHTDASWPLAVDEYIEQLKTWAKTFIEIEKQYYHRRKLHFETYYTVVEPTPSNSRVQPRSPELKAAFIEISTTSSLNQFLGNLVAEILGDDDPQEDNERNQVLGVELDTFLQHVIVIVKFIDKLIDTIMPLKEREFESFELIIMENVQQEFHFIQKVISCIPSHVINNDWTNVLWPRVQSLLTPLDGHGICIAQHYNFITIPALHRLISTLKAVAAQATTIPLSTFIQVNIELATKEQWPTIWTSFTAISNAGLAFCCMNHKQVEWQRLVLSIMTAQYLPLPRSHDLEKIQLHFKSQYGNIDLDAFWTDRDEFMKIPMWFNDLKDAKALKELLYDVFSKDDGRIVVADFLLYECISTYPLDIIQVYHNNMASFSRGLGKAYKLLYHWNEQYEWNTAKTELLCKFAGVPIIPNLNGTDEENFLEACASEIPCLANKFILYNFYDYLVENL
ncbi:hypothetical protein THRCLA_00055 [Thraustotheca clavata]|uniref:Calponin-homology (CH) domain-containing protein n=1 Tax=Thraustotheca clavata TaxID=74557 RepID=A0A1W0ACE1_9STRA|nr:hypothetical protein THRCLA_00055 [Thraustotheca clavata]